jgi:hypothetical protein
MTERFVQAYITDAEHITKVFGCKNKVLFQKLVQKLDSHLDYLDDEFEDMIGPTKNGKYILMDIINGKVNHPDMAHFYAYIYEKISLSFGQQIYAPSDDFNESYFSKLKLKPQYFMPLPMPESFPVIYSIANPELEKEQKQFLSLPQWQDVDTKEFEIMKKDYSYAFEKAISENKDLIWAWD